MHSNFSLGNHDVLGAVAGGVREATGMVDENPAGDGHHFGEQTIGSDVGIGRDGQRCHDMWWRNGGVGWCRFGGADVLAILAQMALGGGGGLGKVLAHEVKGESGPSSKISGIGGLSPGRDHGDKTGAV